LGQGFTLVDHLEQVDIRDGSMPRLTFINQNLEADYKLELIVLLKEYVDLFCIELHRDSWIGPRAC
jgi:hypothetical protein